MVTLKIINCLNPKIIIIIQLLFNDFLITINFCHNIFIHCLIPT